MKLNEYIDHTNLKQTGTYEDIKKLCEEAIEYNFKSVCVSPYYVKSAKSLLVNSDVKVCTVIGFPNGYSTTETKVFETVNALKNGADEIDMVMNINAIKNNDFDYVQDEILKIKDETQDAVLKVIVETCFLTEEELIDVTLMCNSLGVDFIKTSTGFGTRGASLEDIDTINKYKSSDLQIKASGGIKTKELALKYIDKGVTRIGTSNGVDIMKGE